MINHLQRFLFEETDIRGAHVRLSSAWQNMQKQQHYPAVIKTQLGQVIAASTLLASSIKFDGSLTLQIRGQGTITMLIAECTTQGNFRGLATWNNANTSAIPESVFSDQDQLAITLNPGQDKKRYQSIVTLQNQRIDNTIEHYLNHSEQIESRLWLGADQNSCSGLLLQRMPQQHHNHDPENWHRICHLASTIKQQELLQLDGSSLLNRLFTAETLRVFKPQPWQFHCHCSVERVKTMLISLGKSELESMLAEQGNVTIDCEYCNQHYAFDAIDITKFFTPSYPNDNSKTQH